MNTNDLEREAKFYISHALDRSVALREIETFYGYITSPNEINRLTWIYEKLLREARKYRKRGIPIDRWPQTLQSISDEHIDDPFWYCRLHNALKELNQGIEPKKDIPQLPTIEDVKEEEKSQTGGSDPFRSDRFGTLLGGEDRSQYGLGNRRIR